MRALRYAAAALVALGCASVGPAVAEDAALPWTLEAPHLDMHGGPRILILYDMEGLAGQDNVETFFHIFPEQYARGQEMLAADINAVVDGLFAGGAASVDIVDGHGSGNPDPDLRTDLLDPRAHPILRTTPFGAYDGLADESGYDAVVQVGGHAKTGGGGFASHTVRLGTDIILNGVSVTETELLALSWGRYGRPVIFSSGDDRLAANLRQTMPWIEFVVTKEAIDAGAVRLRPVDQVHAEMRAAARRAVRRLSRARVMRICTPIDATVRAVSPASLRMMQDVPGVHYSEPGISPGDSAVSFQANDWASAMTGVFAIVGASRYGTMQSVIDQYAREGDMTAADRFLAERIRVWVAQESGRLTPAPTVQRAPGEPVIYHGIP